MTEAQANTRDSARTIHALLTSRRAHRALIFVSPTKVVRATRRTYRDGRNYRRPIEISVTIGKPNCIEHQMVKQFKKAGEPFPVKKVQLRFTKR